MMGDGKPFPFPILWDADGAETWKTWKMPSPTRTVTAGPDGKARFGPVPDFVGSTILIDPEGKVRAVGKGEEIARVLEKELGFEKAKKPVDR